MWHAIVALRNYNSLVLRSSIGMFSPYEAPQCLTQGPTILCFYCVHASDFYLLDESDRSAKGRPSRIRLEKSGESLAAGAGASMRRRAFNSQKVIPPVTMKWRSYSSSSPLPLSRMRQSHGT